MKRIFVLIISLVFIVGCVKVDNTNKIRITNLLNSARNDAIIEVNLSLLKSLPAENELSKLSVFNGETQLVSQIIDKDLDGKANVIIFQDNLAANESKEYSIKILDTPVKFDSKVFAMFVDVREDLAWESDKAAFRMYGPPLAAEVDNGIDVWSKSVDYPIVAKWYKEEEEGQSYHVDNGEGADFYSVGKSLGCGGSALMIGDKLYQSGVFNEYKIIDNGPLRVRFELTYKDFNVNGSEVSENKIISIDAGSYLNKVEEVYSSKPKDAVFTAGLVERENLEKGQSDKFAYLWGNTSAREEDGQTGIAVLMPTTTEVKELKGADTHLSIIDNNSSDAYVYYTGSGWSKRGDISTKEDWENYLINFGKELESPLKVEIVN